MYPKEYVKLWYENGEVCFPKEEEIKAIAKRINQELEAEGLRVNGRDLTPREVEERLGKLGGGLL